MGSDITQVSPRSEPQIQPSPGEAPQERLRNERPGIDTWESGWFFGNTINSSTEEEKRFSSIAFSSPRVGIIHPGTPSDVHNPKFLPGFVPWRNPPQPGRTGGKGTGTAAFAMKTRNEMIPPRWERGEDAFVSLQGEE